MFNLVHSSGQVIFRATATKPIPIPIPINRQAITNRSSLQDAARCIQLFIIHPWLHFIHGGGD